MVTNEVEVEEESGVEGVGVEGVEEEDVAWAVAFLVLF